MDQLLDLLAKLAPGLVAMFAGVSPVLGGIAAIGVLALFTYIGWRSAKIKWAKEKEEAGSHIGENTGGDQSAAGNVGDKLDDFLNGKK